MERWILPPWMESGCHPAHWLFRSFKCSPGLILSGPAGKREAAMEGRVSLVKKKKTKPGLPPVC